VNVVSTLGRSIGGPLGGLLADTIGWRWSFAGQGPVILLAIVLVALRLPARSSTDQLQQKGHPSKLRRIDFVGAFSLAVTSVAFLGALSLGGQNLPWSHPIVISLTIGSVILGCLFVAYEAKYALEPVFPPALVIQRDVATSYAIMALQMAAQIAVRHPSSPLFQ
jgi:MFS family permease